MEQEKEKRTFRQKWYYFWKYGLKEKYFDSVFYRYFASAITHPKNFFFCLKYPFWRSRNVWTGKFMGYRSTWYDMIMPGWQKAFGKQLSDAILAAGKEYRKEKHKHIKWSKMLRWEDIKQKWGYLCLYNSSIKSISKITDTYEHLSIGYCETCGKPARYVTSGYVSFICEDCYEESLNRYNLTEKEKQESRDEDKLTKEDLPEITSWNYEELKVEKFRSMKACRARQSELYDSNTDHDLRFRVDYDNPKLLHHERVIENKQTYLEAYNIDLEKLWGLK